MDDTVPLFQQTLTPLGRDVVPAGDATFADLMAGYAARLRPGGGPVHISAMTTMAECRAAILAARQQDCFPVWVSWACDENGESDTRVHMLAALFVAEGMGAAAFGLDCPESLALDLLGHLAPYATATLFYVREGEVVPYPYTRTEKDPDVIPCATGTRPCFVTRTVDVGEGLECSPDLLEDIIAAEDDPVGAVKIVITEEDDVDIFAQHQYAIQEALCLWSDVPDLLEEALKVYQGRAFYDGTGDLERPELDRLCQTYGLIVL
jgi:5-methyltetrahydrofolate--homocysteine methyltransferase